MLPRARRVWAETEKDSPINLKVEAIFVNPIDQVRAQLRESRSTLTCSCFEQGDLELKLAAETHRDTH
jgi:hypothetical protein